MKLDKVFVIAEAGVNHNGSIKLAYQLIDAAVDAGADAVKFQTFKAENLVTKNAEKAKYQLSTTDSHESQFEMIKNLELDLKMHKQLIKYCKEKNIIFLSTAFDIDSINMLNNLGQEIFKVPSGEINNLPYLRYLGALKKTVILSTGMSSLDDINKALNILMSEGTQKNDIVVLHANTMYPTPMEDVNLNAMRTISESFNVECGYSDHTLGIEVDIAAAALGAKIIEKHFTLDRKLDGPDHKASLEPFELKEMINSIRNIEKALGDGIKRVTISEKENIGIARKSIVARKNIKKGEYFSDENITVKRPGTGISPMMWDSIIGEIATKDYEIDDLL